MNSKAETKVPVQTMLGEPSVRSLESMLRKHPFLNEMIPHQLRLLSDCSMQTHFKAGELILQEGDPANRFYLIQQGRVALESFISDKGNTPIQTIGAGEVLGWSWLF